MSDEKQQPAQSQALLKKEPTAVEYVPYGAQDKVKMTVAIIQNLIAVKTKTGKTCSDRDAIKFMAMCQAKRMNPFEGDCFLIGYDGREGPNFALVTAHQTYLKRAELHPEFDGMKSGVIVREDGLLKDLEGDYYDEGQQVVGGWAMVYFKNRKQPMNKRLRLARFQKPFGVWQEDPAGMICKCAEADALRSSFPTMLGGLYLREEIEVETRKPEFAKPLFDTGAALPMNGLKELPDTGHAATAVQSKVEKKPDGTMVDLRRLLTDSKVTEGKLLEYLGVSGATDGSQTTLDEVPAAVIKTVVENWPDVVARMAGGEA